MLSSSKNRTARNAAALAWLSAFALLIGSVPALADEPIPANTSKFYKQAYALLLKRKIREAMTLINDELAKNPNDAPLLSLRGRAYMTVKKRELAIKDFTASLNLSPIADTYRARAYVYKSLGDAHKRLEDCKTVVKIEPTAENVLEVARAQIAFGQVQECIEGCKKALTMLDTEAPNKRWKVERNINEVMGTCYLGLNEPAKALGPLTKAVHLMPGYAEAKRKEKSDAPLATSVDYPDGNSNRGEALEKLGRLKEAIVEYEVAVKARPKNFDYRRSLLRAYRKAGQNDKALILVTQMLGEDDSPDLFYKRAEIYKKLGKSDLAKIDEERAKKTEYLFMGRTKPQ